MAIYTIPYKFDDSTTLGTPAAGYFRGNDATFEDSTKLCFNSVDSNAVNTEDFLNSWAGGKILLALASDPSYYYVLDYSTYSFTGGHQELTITSDLFERIDISGANFALNDDVLISFFP